MTNIQVTYFTKKERLCQSVDRAPLFLTITLPQFSIENEPCELPNQALLSLAEHTATYLKTDFWENEKGKYGIRHPINTSIYTNVHRMDKVLLSVEMILRAEQKHAALLEKHVYLHFSQTGTLPLTARDLTGKPLSCLKVSDQTATDPTSGKVYALKKKYRKEK